MAGVQYSVQDRKGVLYSVILTPENALQGVWLTQVPHHGQGVVLLHHVDPGRGVQRHVRPDHVQGEALRHPDGVALGLNSLYTTRGSSYITSAAVTCQGQSECWQMIT